MIGADLVVMATVATLVGTGIFLLLERSLTRIVVGVVLVGNGVNLFILLSGGVTARPPIRGLFGSEPISDPLPQVMVLTAIVITLALVAFLLSLAHRAVQLTGDDEVRDDEEDRRVISRVERELARHRVREELERTRRIQAEHGFRAGLRARLGLRGTVRKERRRLRRRMREEWERQMAADDPERAIDTTMGDDSP
ncbi:Na(+)/H(+) antiporter subunit C [Spongiactinospora sp. TRM90649]|uniref:Na(+)/H(+) antiporter subunit C n=1 Tax=Spongiactinospora sp. TRM90649 TaxID=3031114 RepID=UPI0023F6CCD4|nr:Na(+)/H(+) antiporter subunit C [Spongiactinospora sp. TRM90649]MDF5756029.1 Na(+)/H(+) antiporter subunit C [Spongiactinospora sp. TRM90649]